MTTLENLQEKDLAELVELTNKYRFASIFPVLAAKKAYHESSSSYDSLLEQAALRVPSRRFLKKYITETPPTKGSLERILAAPFINDRKKTSTDSQLLPGEPLQKATEVDEGEIVLENLETLRPVAMEEIDITQEVVVDGNRKEIKVYNQDLDSVNQVSDTEVDQVDLASNQVEWNNDELKIGRDVNETENVNSLLEEPTIQTEDVSVIEPEEAVIEELNNEEEIEEILSDQEESSLVSEEFQEVYTESDFEELEIIDSDLLEEVINEHDLERPKLPIEDDEIVEIGDQLVGETIDEHGDSSSNFIDESLPVSSLVKGGETSMYQKIVNLLKDDTGSSTSQTGAQHIVENQEPTEKTNPEQKIDITDSSITQVEDIDVYDQELEDLYATAAYEANLNQEAKSMAQLENDEDENESDSSSQVYQNTDVNTENHTFTEWLSQLSQIGSDFYQDQQSQKVRPTEFSPQSVNQANQNIQVTDSSVIQNDDSGDDLYNEDGDKHHYTTKEVQEMAKKSLVPNKSYYTETLAHVYVMQDKYDKAIEVYEYLALKNPEKSRYFADQIKLLNENLK